MPLSADDIMPLRILALVVCLSMLLPAAAQAEAILEHLTIIAPAAPGGGWDQTARAMQHALQAEGIVRTVDVVNIAGAAGTIGLAEFSSNYVGRDDAILVMGLVMLAAVLWNDSRVTLADATSLARLTGEWEVIAVPANSPHRTMGDLIAALKANPSGVSWGGGSAGGTDHVLAGLITGAVGLNPRNVNYIPFSGGGEALTALLGGSVTAGVSGYGELAAHLQSGRLRALAVSSPMRVPALDIPTLREQGIPVDIANWRGIMTAAGLSAEARARLGRTMAEMVRSKTWQQTLKDREWDDMYLAEAPFAQFLEAEDVRVTPIVARLRGAPTAASGGLVEWLFPGIVGLASAVVALVLLRQGTRRTRDTTRRRGPVNSGAVVRVIGGLAVYLVTLYAAGFVIASTLLFTAVAAAFGRPHPIRAAAIGLAFSAAIFIAFTRGLGLELPAGVFARWMR